MNELHCVCRVTIALSEFHRPLAQRPYCPLSFAPGWYPKDMEATVSDVSREFGFSPHPFHDVPHVAPVYCGVSLGLLDFKNPWQRTCFVGSVWRCFPWGIERTVRKSFAWPVVN
jgi:hypothetical protein